MLAILGIVILIIIVFCFIKWRLNFSYIIKLMDNANTLVGGLRGTGKDMLFANYADRTKVSDSYISMTDYKLPKKKFIKLNLKLLDTKNNYKTLIENTINLYNYPYPEKAPILLPDCQLYFPAAYQEYLKRDYSGVVNYFPLSRHLSNNQIHCNSQNGSMIWDKLRIQSDIYILCMSCKVIFGFVFMNVRIYENYDSFIKRVPPYRAPRKSIRKLSEIDMHKISYMATYGNIKKYKLFFKNRSKYNTRYFKELFSSVGRDLVTASEVSKNDD